ncbi:MAG: hypothetical protein LBD42_06435 [Desulfovibrio sp.]|jgi:3-hydroxyacyl-[acyl-carrier-protein] dehydratase|nr:hypothetical protein [Desulfovibrio sp.]
MNAVRHSVRAACKGATPLPSPRRGWESIYCFTEDSLVFAGHFPGHPVLPAVVQILMGQTVVERALGGNIRLRGVPQAKFLAPVGPGTEISIVVEAGQQEGLWQCSLSAGGILLSRYAFQAE